MQLNFKVTAGIMGCYRYFCVYSLKFYICNMYREVQNSGLSAMGYPAIVFLWSANYCIKFLIIYLISSFPRHLGVHLPSLSKYMYMCIYFCVCMYECKSVLSILCIYTLIIIYFYAAAYIQLNFYSVFTSVLIIVHVMNYSLPTIQWLCLLGNIYM